MNSGINQKNFEYWKNDIYIKYHRMPDEFATLYAHRVCHEQEIKKLKERIKEIQKEEYNKNNNIGDTEQPIKNLRTTIA